jgi:hypothetical protein
MAKGGQFILGLNGDLSKALSFRAPEIHLVSHSIPTVVDIDTPLSSEGPLQLSTDFMNNGFTRIQLASDKGITVESNSPINLQMGSSLNLNAPKIEINSDINSVSGQISANAITPQSITALSNNGLKIADGITIDVSGRWVNDSLVPLDRQPTEALFTRGGSISLQQAAINGSLLLGDNVSLLANGGAWYKRTGAVAGGSGGSISIKSSNNNTADLNQSFEVGNDLNLQAYGVEGATGGSFNLRVPRLEIVEDSQWLRPQQVTTSTNSTAVRIGSSLFSDYGFSTFTLQADSHALLSDDTNTTLLISPNTEINLTPLTLSLSPEASNYSSGSKLKDIGRLAELPSYQMMPSSLTLLATTALGNRKDYGGIVMANNSKIAGPTDTTVNMMSMGNLTVGGEIDVPSGIVNLSVIKSAVDNEQQFEDRQLTLQSSSIIDVSGGTILKPSDVGLRQGVLSNGGDVTIKADIGSIKVESGSLIDISGAQATLDQKTYGSNGYTTQALTSVGGSLSLQGAESITMLGDLNAQGGSNGNARNTGGSLNVTLTRQLPISGAETFDPSPRVLEIKNGAGQSAESGFASINSDLIKDSGIASLSLSADNQIAINSGVELDVSQRLLLNAPEIKVEGEGEAKLTAAYVTLGPQQSVSNQPVAKDGEGELLLSGEQQIDITGSLAFQNKQTTLSSKGAINLEGYGVSINAPGGVINTTGNLILEASQVVPTTGSDFTINASGDDSTVQIKQIGSVPALPMSVAGSLNINAANIIHEGTVVAPFGSIALDARKSLQLLDGSVTSVSGNGSVLPYGRVDNGTAWVWGVNPEDPSSVSSTPERRIQLTGNATTLASGAVIDVSGGGDLLAYQFTPGTGGKADALMGKAKGFYAIVPTSKGQAVPYDPMMWAGSDITPGESIYLAGGSEVPAGMYQLMPARYALLPGAYLVSAVSGFQDMQPGVTASTTDGAKVVAGYRNFGNKPNEAARFNGFVVRPGNYARQLAQYDDQFASKFFADHASDTSSRTKITQDAGTLSLAVRQSLEALATVRGQASGNGLNADVEIQAPVIEITNSTEGSGADGAAQLSSALVKDWHVGGLLLGGQRNSKGEVTVGADSVTLDNGTELVADEVVLVANQEINIEDNAKLASSSGQYANNSIEDSKFSQPDSLKLIGDNSDHAAVLAVSDLSYLVTERQKSAAIDGASINIAPSGIVATRGSLSIDSVGDIQLSNGINAEHASWDLGAAKVAFGSTGANQEGLIIEDSLIDKLQTARDIIIKSASDIEIYQGLVLGATGGINSVDVRSDRVNNFAGDTASSISANKIVLNGNIGVVPVPEAGEGTIEFNAKDIELNRGQLGFSGFSGINLNSSGVLVGRGDGGVSTAGDLNITASAITADSGSHTRLDASNGTLKLLSANAQAPSRGTFAAGGTLDIGAKDIVDEARIIMPSGVVSLSATNSLVLQGNSFIDAAGINPPLAISGSNGGSIHLESQGSLVASSGTRLDVSAGNNAQAGALSVHASNTVILDGMVKGSANSEDLGGAFSLQSDSLDNFTALSHKVQAGGFTGQQNYRVKEGNLTLDQGVTIEAKEIELTADGGSVNIAGSLLARSNDQRSHIILNAKEDVIVGANAVLDASAYDVENKKAGTIELSSTQGRVDLDNTAQIKSTGKAGSGRLILRAAATENDLNITTLPNDLSKVDLVEIEPINSYQLNNDLLIQDQLDRVHDSLSDYIEKAGAHIGDRFNLDNLSNVVIRPYADITQVGDLSLSSKDYSSWRFGSNEQPAEISIRATGNINLNGLQGDGFTGTGNELDILDQESASFNLVAGADLTSASNRAVVLGSDKDLILSDGAILRAGTGNINLSTSGDIFFGENSSIYTAGVKGTETGHSIDGNSVYADQGGTISLNAGKDVNGFVVSQAVNDWQAHQLSSASSDGMRLNWGVDYNSFGWNVGALGGGDILVRSGGSIRDLSAAVADSQIFDADQRSSFGGGNLNLVASNDIQSGYFYVGKGRGDIKAWGALSASGNRKVDQENLDTFLVSGDASYSISTTNDLSFEGLLHNPALLFTKSAEQEAALFVNRYSQESMLSLQSTGGRIDIKPGNYYSYKEFGNYEGNDEYAKLLYPSSLQIKSFSGDVLMQNSPVMSPSSQGGIEIYASHNIVAKTGITMSDVLSRSPTDINPSQYSDFVNDLRDSTEELLHSNDPKPVYIAAGQDIVNLQLALPKAANIKAGRDIIDLSLQGQQLGKSTTTLIQAGRDVMVSEKGDTREIAVGGTGALQVIAGRDINLGFSKGIYTTGNLRNGNLPADSGARIYVVAGLGKSLGINTASTSQVDDFLDVVIRPSSDLKNELVDYMVSQTGGSALNYESASQVFRTLSVEKQIPFAVNVLFSELVKSGRETNEKPELAFKRGYVAIENLFPGSQSTSNPYRGSVSLPFSRIYSLDGGDIAVLAPGGKVDVGLANTPASLAKIIGNRPASELGIVAQQSGDVKIMADQDVLVNTSRVFTLGGGDIAIWSSKGNIDAGKGAKSAISAPPPTLIVDAAGNVSINFASAVAGSGIRTISTGKEVEPGDVDLIAPAGFVNAGDAGIGSSGNLNIAAQSVVGLDNIQVGGASTGVPPEAGGLGASLSGVTNSASSSTSAASSSVADASSSENKPTVMADAALSWLEVFVIGLGEDVCKQDDLDCLKRQTLN